MEARYVLDRALEQEQGAAVAARSAWRGDEAQRILGLAQLAFGDLRGLLLGIPTELLDRTPWEGEWTMRQTLAHAVNVERSYRANTRWALDRASGDPLTVPTDQRPQPDPADTAGAPIDIVRALARRRDETHEVIGELDDAALRRPSQWGSVDVDVRFRLHRFASHLVEHTVQLEKALDALGWHPGDAPREVRRISSTRAMHERISSPEVLAALDADHRAKADAIGA